MGTPQVGTDVADHLSGGGDHKLAYPRYLKESFRMVASAGRWRLSEAHGSQPNRAVLSRSALPTTLTEDSAIAAAAITGESRIPKNGYSAPAATGTPAAL